MRNVESHLTGLPGFTTLRVHFVIACHRDLRYAVRLVTRIRALGERIGSARLLEVSSVLRTALLGEFGQHITGNVLDWEETA